MDSLSQARLLRWMRGALGEQGEYALKLVVGGRSNMTWVVELDSRPRWVLRHPPIGNHVEGGHDVVREARIVESLAGSEVPVPRVVAIVEDLGVIGVPFVVMEHVSGNVVRDSSDALAALPADRWSGVTRTLVEVLHRVHAVDVSSLPVRRSSRPISQRLLARWLEQSRREECADLAVLEEAHDLLAARQPEGGAEALVHGDYRLENCMIDEQGGIVAVLDWELATVGDPLADVGLLLAYWAQPDDAVRALNDPPTLSPGFPTREEVAAEYLAVSGRSRGDLDFFEALGWWKVACIVGGVHSRIRRGVFAPPDRTEESYRIQAEGLAAEALRRARALGPR